MTGSRPDGWGATGPLQDVHDVLLLDLDGVVYVGDGAVPRAAEALAAARRAGVRLAFVTNNASRTADSVAEHLTRIGVGATANDVITSAQAAATVLAGRLPGSARVLVIGGQGLRSALSDVGLVAVDSADDDPVAVVQGFAPEVGWTMLLEACVAVRAGLPWVATNLDLSIPTPRGTAPGNGALVEVVRRTTGVDPEVTGKPRRPIMDDAVRRTGATRALVVGDRLDTDIAGAVSAGLPSMLVLTGVNRVHDLLAADPSMRPTFVSADLDGLAADHPGCARDDDGWWRCAAVAARVGRDAGGRQRLEIEPPAPGSEPDAAAALQAVRAVCAAVWSGVGTADDDPVALVTAAAAALSAWTAPHGWDR